jgi:hypothetical protein
VRFTCSQKGESYIFLLSILGLGVIGAEIFLTV